MLNAFADGGIWMYPVVLAGLTGIGICLAWLFQALARRESRLGAFAWAGIAGVVALGLLGSAIGFQQTMQAAAAAAPDQRVALESMSSAISLYPLVLALGVAAVELVLVALAGTLQANLGGRPA